MKAEVEIVSVAMAKEYLEHNVLNRPLREKLVAKYAGDIRAGRWECNGEPIILGVNGELLDGQHRCAAIVLAQQAITTLVVRNADPRTFKTLGAGAPRSLADVFTIEKHFGVNLTCAASMARLVVNYIGGGSMRSTPTKSQLIAFADQHPYLFEVSKKVGAPVPKIKLPRAQLGAVLFLANEKRGFDEEMAKFYEGLASGEGLWRGDPRLTLREWLHAIQSQVGGRHVVRGETYFAACARAWNAYASGRELVVIKQLDSPTRASLPIVGFDRLLYGEVPDVGGEARTEAWKANLAKAHEANARKRAEHTA